jgi:hypothetical protein
MIHKSSSLITVSKAVGCVAEVYVLKNLYAVIEVCAGRELCTRYTSRFQTNILHSLQKNCY